MKKVLFAASAAVLAIVAVPASAATNLLTNGTFQNGSLSGWTLTESGTNSTTTVASGSNDNITTSPSPDANSGNYAYFTTDTGTSQLSQTVSLLAGHTYSLGFDYAALNYQNAGNVSWALSIGGLQVGSFNTSSTQANTWYTTNANVVANGNSLSQFSFVFTGGSGASRDLAVDRFYLIDTTASAVPEPASWTMMLLGFGAIGFAVRSNRQRQASALA